MDNREKAIAVVIYLIALAVAALISESVFGPVAIIGIVLFFIVHITLRSTRSRQHH
jgi:hypothetical protein